MMQSGQSPTACSACGVVFDTVLGLQPPSVWETGRIYGLCCKGLGKGRPVSFFFCFGALHSFLSLEVLPEQQMNFTIKTRGSCVKEGEVFFQKESSDVSAQGNSGSKEGPADFPN